MAKRKRHVETAPFDASAYLDSEEVIAEYLAAALEDPNPNVFLHAVADVAKARGISRLCRAWPE
jgi:probable addiction module antidote protein